MEKLLRGGEEEGPWSFCSLSLFLYNVHRVSCCLTAGVHFLYPLSQMFFLPHAYEEKKAREAGKRQLRRFVRLRIDCFTISA